MGVDAAIERSNGRTGRRPVVRAVITALAIAAAPLLSHFFIGKHRPEDPSYSRADYEKALRELAVAKSPVTRSFALVNAAKTTVYFGSLDDAEQFAAELLESAPTIERNGDLGNAIHDGHAVLGLVALRRGRLDDARHELLLAGDTPGSPQLDTFGPNMLLAKELLARGEVDTVVAYFDRCRRFWKMHRDKLDLWTSDARSGRQPYFGANTVF